MSDESVKPTETTWVTRAGQRIEVADMSDAHLVNTIHYLRRCQSRQMMEATLSISALMKNDPPEEIWDDNNWTPDDDKDDDDSIARQIPTWPALLAEAKKRGLEA